MKIEGEKRKIEEGKFTASRHWNNFAFGKHVYKNSPCRSS
jgi:hypothetical protein